MNGRRGAATAAPTLRASSVPAAVHGGPPGPMHCTRRRPPGHQSMRRSVMLSILVFAASIRHAAALESSSNGFARCQFGQVIMEGAPRRSRAEAGPVATPRVSSRRIINKLARSIREYRRAWQRRGYPGPAAEAMMPPWAMGHGVFPSDQPGDSAPATWPATQRAAAAGPTLCGDVGISDRYGFQHRAHALHARRNTWVCES